MTHASVFSGIGGPEIAAAMLGWDNLFHCEINPFGRAVLNYWFPKSVSYEDITKTDFSEWRGRVNVLTGGFPCQPFSYAGKRGGAEDDRYLWPYMFRCIDQVRPDWVVCENVAGILTMVEQGEVSEMASQRTLFDEGDGVRRYRLVETFTLQRICDDLEGHGYSVQPVLIPACAVGAPHRRDRVFIVGHRTTSDSDLCADGRKAGEYEGEGREERLQERDEIQQPHVASEVRPESANFSENTMHGRRLRGQDEKQGGKRNVGNAGPGDSERICGETSWSEYFYQLLRYSANTHRDRGDEVHQHLQPGEPNGKESLGYGGQRYVTDTDYAGLERRDKPGSTESRERLHLRRYFAGYGDEGDEKVCGQRWGNFPSVSPVHRGNDGLPFNVDDLTLSLNKWRTESLKAYGNAIVPQVMYEIFRAIEQTTNNSL